MSNETISIDFDSTKLDDKDLSWLLSAADSRLGNKSPRLGIWVADLVAKEYDRRISLETNNPLEPGMPGLNCAAWTNGELADAVTAVLALAFVVDQDRPALSRFCNRLAIAITSWAGHRLRTFEVSK